jgi:hypothetical protein
MSRLVEAALADFFADLGGDFALAAQEAAVVRHRLRIAGRSVQLSFAGAALADALLPALRARLTSDDDGPPDVTLDLFEQRPGGLDVPWRDGHLAAGGLLRGERHGTTLVVHELGTGAITAVDRGARRLIYRARSARELPWWERAAPLRPAFFWALGGAGRGLVHAGAVGDERGGVLLAGPGGSGKTTTALAALDAGMGYVSDDYVMLAGGSAHNVFGTAKLDDGHLARFPRLAPLAARSATPAPEEKAVLDVAGHFPDALTERLEIRAVVVPRIAGGQTGLRPLAAGRALLALAPSTIFQMPFDHGALFPALSELVRGVPCFELAVGDDPAALAAELDRVLDGAG